MEENGICSACFLRKRGAAGKASACRKRAGTLRWARGREGRSDSPSLPLDSTHPAMQQLQPPPVAETGSSCWGSGQQDASAAQGTKRMLGAATRRQGLLALNNPKEEVEAQKS